MRAREKIIAVVTIALGPCAFLCSSSHMFLTFVSCGSFIKIVRGGCDHVAIKIQRLALPFATDVRRRLPGHGCRTFSPPISPSYSPSSPLAGEEVPHPQPGGWDLWYFLPSQGGLGNEVPHPQPGAMGVGITQNFV